MLLVLMVVLPVEAMAQETNVDKTWAFALRLENDFFFGYTDRYYTNGLSLGWTSPDISKFRSESRVLGWANSLLEWFPPTKKQYCRRSLSFTIGQNIYTPEDINRSDLIPDDRPYAGITYATTGIHTSCKDRMDSLELVLGLVGPHSYAGEVQKGVHKLIGIGVAEGWDNQLKDEIIVNILYRRSWKSIQSGVSGGLGYDVLPFLEGVFGNAITFGNAGLQARLGWNLPNDFGISRNLTGLGSQAYSGSPNQEPHKEGAQFGAYVFGSLSGMAVTRNIFLDGNTFADSHSVDKEPFLGEFTWGVNFMLGHFQFNYAHVFQTKEFEGQRGSQKFGSITFFCCF